VCFFESPFKVIIDCFKFRVGQVHFTNLGMKGLNIFTDFIAKLFVVTFFSSPEHAQGELLGSLIVRRPFTFSC
jgi:hypothetical protein